ncbi:hypothetical protein VAR608DRAFT_1688 [Variovorax sp. HW608]|uniref:hypothetical protein n=1 Tax=Variovorax sp. HW608 TaxID=1034889 RepID=UPI0008201A78|nr:hypothetical protein [Variovorax sp. HW608]SCK21866.1 hypothetical protein VAR608DRAFT_1688 [Variovorax sp. HW608]
MMIDRWISTISLAAILSTASCGTAVIREGDPLWKVPIVSRENCLSIDGNYSGKGLFFRQFDDSSINYSAPKFSTFVRYERRISPLDAKDPREQRKLFDANSFVEVRKISSGMEITLYGGDKLPYEGRRISFDHPNVGCDASGNLVLREFSRVGGAELTPRQAHASEVVFHKLQDGSLEVHRWRRNWIKTMRSPPRKENQVTLIFEPAY